MIKKISFKEFKEILREGHFRTAACIVMTLLAVAIYISKNHYETVQREHSEAREDARNIWVSQDDKNPHSAAHYGTYVFKPKYPLSLIDQGVDKFAGISVFLEAHTRNESQFMAAADQTGLARFGNLTPDFILLFIIPLLIILMGYNSFTKEKELGTLRLLKSQGVSSWKLAMGKWWGSFLPIFIITVVLMIIAILLLGSLNDFGSFNIGELLLLFGVYLVYYAVFTNLTLIVSMLSRNSGIALVIMVTIWIVTCLAAPKAASNAANGLYPYPSRQDFETRITEGIQKGLDGHNPLDEQAKIFEKETLEKYGVDSLSQLPFNFDGYRMQKGEEQEAEVYFKHYNVLKEQYKNQENVYRSAAIISPFLPARFLSMAIARTDYTAHWNFTDAAEQYRIKMMKVLNTNFAENSEYGDWDFKADRALWKEIPDFSYAQPGLGSILAQNRSNVGVLFAWLIFSFFGLFLTSKKI